MASSLVSCLSKMELKPPIVGLGDCRAIVWPRPRCIVQRTSEVFHHMDGGLIVRKDGALPKSVCRYTCIESYLEHQNSSTKTVVVDLPICLVLFRMPVGCRIGTVAERLTGRPVSPACVTQTGLQSSTNAVS